MFKSVSRPHPLFVYLVHPLGLLSHLQMCSRGEEAAVRRRLQDEWRAGGRSTEEVGGLLEPQRMATQLAALDRKIQRRRLDVGGAAHEDLEDVVLELRRRRQQLSIARLQYTAAHRDFVVLRDGQKYRHRC